MPTLLDALDEAGNGNGTGHAGAVEEVVLDSWSHGAVLLIGDAAHATSPNMAQGAAMALEDAIVLAESLTAADSIPDAHCGATNAAAAPAPTGYSGKRTAGTAPARSPRRPQPAAQAVRTANLPRQLPAAARAGLTTAGTSRTSSSAAS